MFRVNENNSDTSDIVFTRLEELWIRPTNKGLYKSQFMTPIPSLAELAMINTVGGNMESVVHY